MGSGDSDRYCSFWAVLVVLKYYFPQLKPMQKMVVMLGF
ncbi:hypothetical Protein YC6258_03698 [Gynuella sunshinyii YC6258]|uniref:Uncharacterized protein n=1 Tax=Gynuella sunshinyii YC6258 TaxID=1445510 RepID=A0A0C5VZ94_9GAMM|nr:hypothetical Protein YC6258_03698 [Gynuella sunshinyii YC6258]